MRRQAVEEAALERDGAGLVGERAAQAIDERALARAVRPDQAEALALGDVEIDAIERDKTAEALAEARYLQERTHAAASLPGRLW